MGNSNSNLNGKCIWTQALLHFNLNKDDLNGNVIVSGWLEAHHEHSVGASATSDADG
jgi:hypothetical protein